MKISRITRISILTAILCILSQLSIQVGTVPITLQIIGILLAGFILGPIDGMLSVIIYILLGAFGLPVFAGGNSGFKALFGPTGGYLMAFPLAALLCGYISCRFNNKLAFLAAGILSIALTYIIGVPFLSFMTHMPLSKALIVGAYPFILPDIIKMLLSVSLGYVIKSRLLKENLING